MKRCLIFALLLVFLLTGCFEMQPPASTAPPRTDPPETEATFSGLELSELPDFDKVTTIVCRDGDTLLEGEMKHPDVITYIVRELTRILQEPAVENVSDGWTYELRLLDDSGTEIAYISDVGSDFAVIDGKKHMADSSGLLNILDIVMEKVEPWDPWADFEKIGMEKYPGLEASEMPDFDSVVSICLRNGTDFSEVMITDEAEIEYILSQIPPVLEQTCVKDDFEGWTYMLVLLDAEGNEVARIWKIMTVGISFDGYIHVSDCREFHDYFDKYFE